MAASKERHDVEILLHSVDIGKRLKLKHSKHVVTVELVWPKISTASKVAVKTLSFENGGCNLANAGWIDQILLKETVENHFGIRVKITENLTDAEIRNVLRYLLGGVMGVAGDFADSSLPGYAGDAAEIPFKLAKKELQTSKAAKIILEGKAEIFYDQLQDNALLKIPLLTTEKIISRLRPAERGPSKTRILAEAGTVLGELCLSLRNAI